ncbi:hypothetical protein JTE90_013076 [Oedothorax gibbosus]|uniref:Exocyst complex component 5 n=1 Tax=Oedothorax gibbosus TaxID=931172 RepID=A0AAV6ULM1_9ARAC|nr:hypothetical protein JTE90_013076 [Oedothorax gibbosus]
MSSGSRWGSRRKDEIDVNQLLSELDELFADEPFDPEDYVDRLSLRVGGLQTDGKSFDPKVLHKAFDHSIQHLHSYYETKQRQCGCLETICREEEKAHWAKVRELMEKNKDACETFQELDERIDFVATKVVHLGDQLESVNTPRARAVEAQKLMNHFAELLSPEPVNDGILNDPSKLFEAADIIQKLHLIAQELPSGKPKFEKARQRIAKKYDEIERELIDEFVKCHQSDNRSKMKEVAGILSNFKGYSQCVDAFIEQRQMSLPACGDILTRIVPSCAEALIVVKEVFNNPEQVMSKYILNIFQGKLLTHIKAELMDCGDPEKYLEKFERLYFRTMKLTTELTNLKIGCDPSFLNKLTKNIFARYLENYITIEVRCLKDKSENTLNHYYNSKNHQKKQIHFGGIHDLRRDIQARIGARTNIISSVVDNYGGETFLSEEIAMNMLQDCKKAFNRCQLLSKQPSDLPGNTVMLFDVLLRYLFEEHISYALELGLLAIPLAEPKSPPEIYFFDVIRQCNAIYHLFEKQFGDTIVPLVISTPKHSDCLQKKKKTIEEMEVKLHTGLERCITSILGWVKFLLQSEQKKTDFKPESEMATFDADMSTTACRSVVKFITECLKKIKVTLDGKNIEAVLTELGTKLHRVILDHLQQFQYNSFGAMAVICDVNEYRRCVRDFQIPLVNMLFETLHTLCNLFVVEPNNLKQFCNSEDLACLDRTVLMNFVQLRADYKTAKLVNQFR